MVQKNHDLILPAELSPGGVIAGKYSVERILGVGGMGIVLAARHRELDEQVAIKCLLPHVPIGGESSIRFVREAKAAIKIRSDHVVRVFDVDRTASGVPYIVMEYLDGSDLQVRLEREGPLPISDAIDCMLQVCEAIAAAHAVGIVHRDLKPANIFQTTRPDGTAWIKVLDFGISKVSDRDDPSGLTSTQTILGTPCFMSPEQLRSTRDVDARTDIWALGAIFYALLSGSPPYDGTSNADVSAKIIRDDPEPLSRVREGISDAIQSIIDRCLKKNPEARFADVAELASALAELDPERGREAAIRIARVATGHGPTRRSGAAPIENVDGAPTSNARTDIPSETNVAHVPSGPTCTASAWGETKPEAAAKAAVSKRSRKAEYVIAGIAIAVIGMIGVASANAATPRDRSIMRIGQKQLSSAAFARATELAKTRRLQFEQEALAAQLKALETIDVGGTPARFARSGAGTNGPVDPSSKAMTAGSNVAPQTSARPIDPKATKGLFDGRD